MEDTTNLAMEKYICISLETSGLRTQALVEKYQFYLLQSTLTLNTIFVLLSCVLRQCINT